MKQLIVFLFCVLLMHVAGSAEVPTDVRSELDAVKKAVGSAGIVAANKKWNDDYWRSLKTLGKLSAVTPAPEWVVALTPLEKKLTSLAVNHFEHPSLVKTISDW